MKINILNRFYFKNYIVILESKTICFYLDLFKKEREKEEEGLYIFPLRDKKKIMKLMYFEQ